MMDLAVVTSVWGSYSKFLPAWATSVAAQRLKPRQVAILDAGVDDTAPLAEAIRILDGHDVRTARTPFTSLGDARNQAVALTDTEWLIHLDADDELLPHAVADVHRVHKGYDVVSLGAIHGGRARVYPNITAEGILARKHGVFSCGAFRREYWQQRPWHTHNDWVDSVFWVGLAHLGARFTSTKRVGFIYNIYPESVSHSLSPQDKQAARQQWHDSCRQWTLN